MCPLAQPPKCRMSARPTWQARLLHSPCLCPCASRASTAMQCGPLLSRGARRLAGVWLPACTWASGAHAASMGVCSCTMLLRCVSQAVHTSCYMLDSGACTASTVWASADRRPLAQAGGAAVCARGRAGGPAAVRRGDGVVAAPAAARVPALCAQVPGEHERAGALAPCRNAPTRLEGPLLHIARFFRCWSLRLL
jgi:hypothetical protein